MTINGQPPITEVLFTCKYPGPRKKALFSGRSEVEVMFPHLAKKKNKKIMSLSNPVQQRNKPFLHNLAIQEEQSTDFGSVGL